MISTAIIGAGNMGSALYKGLASKGKADQLWLCDKHVEKSAIAPAERRLVDPLSIGNTADCIILAVKPQSFPALMTSVGSAWSGKFVISIMAGITIKNIVDATKAVAVVRAMPNLCAGVQRGITGWYASSSVTPAQLQHFEDVFSAIGMTVRLKEESSIDGFTAVAGSGPAYVFLLAEMLEQEAAALGIDAQTSAQIANELLASASLLLGKGERSAAAWREAVTSKGGTTEAALGILRDRGVVQIFHEAIIAATERSCSLSRK